MHEKFFIPFWIQVHPLSSLKISCSPLLEGGKATLPPPEVKLPPSNSQIFANFFPFLGWIWLDSKWNKITYLLFIVKSKQNRKFSGNFFLTAKVNALPPQVKCENKWGGKKIFTRFAREKVTAPSKEKSSARPCAWFYLQWGEQAYCRQIG